MKTYKVTVDHEGTIFWYNEKDQLHREDGPAIEGSYGDKHWYIDDKRHRKDGPSIEGANGYKAWFVDGIRHREDGPAVECATGDKEWWSNGKYHREDGPAIEFANGDKYWIINGEQLSEQEFIKRTRKCVELTIQDIENIVGKRVKIVKNKA